MEDLSEPRHQEFRWLHGGNAKACIIYAKPIHVQIWVVQKLKGISNVCQQDDKLSQKIPATTTAVEGITTGCRDVTSVMKNLALSPQARNVPLKRC